MPSISRPAPRSVYPPSPLRVSVALCLLICLFFSPLSAIAQPANAVSPEQKQYDFANGLFHRGFFEEAVDEYKKFLRDYPASPHRTEAQNRLGEAAYATGDFKAALDAFSVVAADENTPPELRRQTLLNKGEALYHLKRHGEALQHLSPLTAEELPAEIRARALYFAGQSHQATGNAGEALAAYNQLAAAFPENALTPFARYQSGLILLSRNDFDAAANALSEVANNPNTDAALRMDSRYRAAEIYDKMGWYDAAVAAYEQLRNEFPDTDYARKAAYGYAWSLFHARQYQQSLEAANQFLAGFPDTPFAPGIEYLIANCHQQLGNLDAAAAAYELVREKHKNSDFAHRAQYKLAWVRHLQGENNDAHSLAQDVISKHPKSAFAGDAAHLLGTLAMQRGAYTEALEAFSRVVADYPEASFAKDAQFKAGECLAMLGLHGEAAAAFDTLAESAPAHPLAQKARIQAGNALFTAQDWDGALARYRAALEFGGAPLLAELHYRIAVTHHNKQDFEASAHAFEAMLEASPESENSAEAYFRMGDYFLHEGKDTLRALGLFQSALDAAPEGPYAPRALRGLALAHYEQNDFDTASKLFARLIQEHPDLPLNEAAYTWLAQHLMDLERWDEAITALQALLKNMPAYPLPDNIHLKIAEAHEKAGRFDEAFSKYSAIRDEFSGSSGANEAVFRMARIHEAKEQPGQAIKLYEEAANATDADVASRACFRLGELYEAQGKHADAARNFMRIAILYLHEELSPKALLRAGDNYAKLGNTAQAHSAWEEVINDYPESPQAEKARERLNPAPPPASNGGE